ncbi:MAG: thioredoxin-dependent thiol peroxidase [Bacteroidales bacterium]
MSHLSTGDPAPDFKAKDYNGNTITMEQFRGKKVILFFYPKANTAGCTAEACNLRDHYQKLTDRGFVLLGVSADNETRQKNFAEKYQFPFPLIADTGKEVIRAYGAWGPKKLYGKEYEGIIRKTFVISETGIIERIFDKVKTKSHAEQILETY